ncbi:hypothetical protein COCHEDRAFT_1093186, partial [Bipolaris maydis C5]
TPLLYAASSGHEEKVQLLLEARGIDSNAQDKSAISWAVEHGYVIAIKLLLYVDYTDSNSKGHSSQTTLARALDNGHETVVKLFAYRDTTTIYTLIQEG